MNTEKTTPKFVQNEELFIFGKLNVSGSVDVTADALMTL